MRPPLLRKVSYAVKDLGTGEHGGQIYGLGVSSGQVPGAGYFLLPYIWHYGGEFQSEEGNIVLDSEGTIAAFDQIKALFEDSVSPSGVEIRDLRELFAQGRIAFHWDIEAMVATFASLSPRAEEFRNAYEILLIPGEMPQTPTDTISIFHTLTIYEESPYQEEAALFIDFLTGPEGIAIYNANGGNKLPVRSSSGEIEFYAQPENAFLDVFIQAIEGPARSLPAQSSAFLDAMGCDVSPCHRQSAGCLEWRRIRHGHRRLTRRSAVALRRVKRHRKNNEACGDDFPHAFYKVIFIESGKVS